MHEDRRFVGAHLHLAKEALEGARMLVGAGNRNAVYLAQQGAEQLILAIAQSERIQFPRHKHHQLDHMVRALPQENPFRGFLDDVTWLEAFATAYRYPKTSGRVSPQPDRLSLSKALLRLLETHDLLARYFEVEMRGPDHVARHCVPPRAAEPDADEEDKVDYVEMTAPRP